MRQIKTSSYQKACLVAMGLLLTFILLESALRLGGFIILSLQERRNTRALLQRGAYRIMCLGESTTQNQYPRFLEQLLNQRDIGIRFSVIDKGLSGTNTSVILSHLESNLDNYHPDMVIAMMGINDTGFHMPYEYATSSKAVLFMRSLRTYKLVELLRLHIKAKSREPGSFRPQDADAIPVDRADPKEREYEKAIATNPSNDMAYVELARFYRESGNSTRAEEILRKAIAINPRNEWAYNESARFYRETGKLVEAEEAFKKAIALNPGNDSAYVELAGLRRESGRSAEAAATLRKAIAINPRNEWAYLEWARLYRESGESTQAEATLRKAIATNPGNEWAYEELANFYRDTGRPAEAEEAFKKAIAVNPRNEWPYLELARFYSKVGRLTGVEETLRKVRDVHPSDHVYGALSTIYREMGNHGLADQYYDKATELRLREYILGVMTNYHKLKAILERRGIRLVCVQYPMRSIEPLKKMFQEHASEIVFVDNAQVFQDAVSSGTYDEFFLDRFGGDFGHCTEKGNRLLAENIAQVILKKVFGK